MAATLPAGNRHRPLGDEGGDLGVSPVTDGAYEVTPMAEGAVREFLGSHSVGVLGLATDGAPSLRPMSFWFDGEEHLYMLYVLGPDSRKAALSERDDPARFLVYSAETPFSWRSVLVTGQLRDVPEEEADSVREPLKEVWRPEAFRAVVEHGETAVYELAVEDWTGLESSGLPPGFEPADEGA